MTREQKAKLAALRRCWLHPAQDLDAHSLRGLLYLLDTAPDTVLSWAQRFETDRLVWRYRRQIAAQLGRYPSLGFELPPQEPEWEAYRAAAESRRRRSAEPIQARLL